MKKFWNLFLTFFAILSSLYTISFTYAYYSSKVDIKNFSLSMGTWPKKTLSGPQPGDVVINELMWMGSTIDSNDEWIELRNTTNSSIDLSGWKLSMLKTAEEPMITISSGIIPANGYFLISEYSKDDSRSALNKQGLVNTALGLRNSNLQIKLYKGSINPDNLMDTADDGIGLPLAGDDNGMTGPRKSMSRKLVPADGTISSNWFNSNSNSSDYWDSENGNFGTPGGPNV